MARTRQWLRLLVLSISLGAGFALEEMLEKIAENDVSVVTRNNLRYLIQTNRILLIMCYVPWDKKYQEKISDYEKLAKFAFQTTEDVTLAKLDVAGDAAAAADLEVQQSQGLQFIFFRKGVSFNFADPGDIKSLATKLKTVADPAWSPPEVPLLINRVKEIQKKNFVNELPDKVFSLVLFYKPGSFASERLLYDFEIAVNSLKVLNGIKQSFHKFDADGQHDTMAKYGVKTLPCLKFFKHGRVHDYNGPLVSPPEMKKYIASHMERPYTTIPDPAEFEAFVRKNPDRSTVVGFFASLTLSAFPNFVEAAETLRDRFNFVLMSTPVVSSPDTEPKQAEGWTLAVFLPKRQHTPEDEQKSVLQYEGASYEMIVDFIKWKATSLAGERTRKNADIAYSLRPLVVVYSKVDWSKAHRKETEYLRDKVARAAKDHKDTLFCFSDATEFADEVDRFGFDTDSKYDLHVGILGKDGEYYARWDTTHMSSAMISEFVKQYKEGEVKPFYRSNTTAVHNTVVGVHELTGDSFQSLILEGTSDALILMYHPLSKHWRLAQSVFKDLAQDPGYKRQGVIIAEMDVSINDAPANFRLPTYPVIYFVPKHDKLHPAMISGDICGEYGIRQFLKEQLEKSAQPSSPKTPESPQTDKTTDDNVKTEL